MVFKFCTNKITALCFYLICLLTSHFDDFTAKHGGVNNLPESSKVIKMARKKTNKVKAKRSNLVCTNLKDHRKKTRCV